MITLRFAAFFSSLTETLSERVWHQGNRLQIFSAQFDSVAHIQKTRTCFWSMKSDTPTTATALNVCYRRKTENWSSLFNDFICSAIFFSRYFLLWDYVRAVSRGSFSHINLCNFISCSNLKWIFFSLEYDFWNGISHTQFHWVYGVESGFCVSAHIMSGHWTPVSATIII